MADKVLPLGAREDVWSCLRYCRLCTRATAFQTLSLVVAYIVHDA